MESGSWVDGVLAGGSLVGDAAATVIDPFSALLANGLGWVMEHFEPLRELLDKLAGIPDKVTAHAQTWANMAGSLQAMAEDLQSHLAADLPDWGGSAADSYQSMMTNNVDGLGALAVLADTMSAATQAAGNLVQFTRDIVRDLICDLVARVIVWAAEALAIVTIPVVTAQIISAVAKWCARIFGYTGALISSLQNLTALMQG
ncbi:WXG100 family type VII secretion target [Winogradskya consettensis]|uniref:WXG100 family type VII secretion target n=1 Tax=Winogradskya consettensis TaxID=113560 RepID=UPI001FD4753C|nr:WXG100 family type VII secretion target [Actinoplanes consettensis]